MGIFAPELTTAGSSVQAVAPPVNLTEDQLTNIGKGIADIIGGIIPPKPIEGLISDQETEEDYVIPEGTPQTTPASSTSGLPIEAQAFLDAIASAEGTGGDSTSSSVVVSLIASNSIRVSLVLQRRLALVLPLVSTRSRSRHGMIYRRSILI